MQVTLKDNYVENFSVNGQLENGIEVADIEDIMSFLSEYKSYTVVDGKLVKDLDKAEAEAREATVERLRERRKRECFPVINRGQLWYDLLTDQERSELTAWYSAWLDVTETLEPPDMPEWLGEVKEWA